MPGWGRILRSEATRWIRRGDFDHWPRAEPLGIPETFEVQPAIYHRDHLERIVKTGFNQSLAAEIEKLDAREVRSSPPVKTVFTDVVSCGGRFYGPDASYFLIDGSPVRDAFLARPAYDHVLLTNSALGLRYFGHWLRDDCAARELPLPEDADLRSFVRPDWSDCSFYESAFGQTWNEEPTFFARKLSLLTDIGFSQDKRRRLDLLRDRLRRTITTGRPIGGIAYIRRGQGSVPRTMTNEEKLIGRLSEAGVRIVEAETGGEAIVENLLDAKIIIGIEGSQLTHATYNLADGGALLVIQPPDRFYNPHHEWARLLGMRYGLVVGHAHPDGYTVDIDDVMAMIECLNRTIEQPGDV